ncbi:MAG: twin-arginine translocase TatA/TatE family subunit [Solirubrobacteraceae bacterium]
MLGLDNPIHIAFLLVILLLVFGAKRLPEMGKSLGEGLRGFKDSISGEAAATHMAAEPEATPQPLHELTQSLPVTGEPTTTTTTDRPRVGTPA